MGGRGSSPLATDVAQVTALRCEWVLSDVVLRVMMFQVDGMHVVQNLHDPIRYALDVVRAAHGATQFLDVGDHHCSRQREDLVAITANEFRFGHGRTITPLSVCLILIHWNAGAMSSMGQQEEYRMRWAEDRQNRQTRTLLRQFWQIRWGGDSRNAKPRVVWRGVIERRARDSNPQVLADAGFQDQCNSHSASSPMIKNTTLPPQLQCSLQCDSDADLIEHHICL